MSSANVGAASAFWGARPSFHPHSRWRRFCDAVLYEVRFRTTLLSLSRPPRPGAVFAVVVNRVCPIGLTVLVGMEPSPRNNVVSPFSELLRSLR